MRAKPAGEEPQRPGRVSWLPARLLWPFPLPKKRAVHSRLLNERAQTSLLSKGVAKSATQACTLSMDASSLPYASHSLLFLHRRDADLRYPGPQIGWEDGLKRGSDAAREKRRRTWSSREKIASVHTKRGKRREKKEGIKSRPRSPKRDLTRNRAILERHLHSL